MFEGASILLLFALVIGFGTLGGEVARRFRLPPITGQILAGVVLGGAALNVVPGTLQQDFAPVASLALSFVAVTIGGHLEFRRLHNAVNRILIISAVQFTVVFSLTFWVFQWLNPLHLEAAYRLPVHLILASIATSSSPISTIHAIQEREARGLLVKTVVAVLAVNNFLTICVYEIVHSIGDAMLSQHDRWNEVFVVISGEFIALAVGGLTGMALVVYSRYQTRMYHRMERPGRRGRAMLNSHLFTGLLITVCLTAGLCEFATHRFTQFGFRPSPVLANMMVGLVLANFSSFKEDLLSLFSTMEHGIFTCFFVLAGMHLNLLNIQQVWLPALIFLLVRLVGMIGGGFLGALAGKSTQRISRFIGPLLSIQGAIAIALVVLLETDMLFHDVAELMISCVVTACVVSELVGPALLGRALDSAGETHRDRARLIEFLQEEFIDPHLKANDKWEAIESLCHFMCRTHRTEESPHQILEAIKERERSMPTGIGHGIAVPHAKIKLGRDIIGVLGKLDKPVDFGAPDGEPARLIVMVATPEDQVDKHLQVIAAVSRMMSHRKIRDAIFNAETAAEIHEIIDSQEADTFNYFMET